MWVDSLRERRRIWLFWRVRVRIPPLSHTPTLYKLNYKDITLHKKRNCTIN